MGYNPEIFVRIREEFAAKAEKARSDKKNSDDDKIKMAVAVRKGKWTILSLPFEEYKAQLLKAAKAVNVYENE